MNITKINGILDEYIPSGFIDAHMHIESPFLIPLNFAHLVVQRVL
ncbi:hypothetical protein [Borreliella turdi]|nr:hypothetical protein [Borreliella turdi]